MMSVINMLKGNQNSRKTICLVCLKQHPRKPTTDLGYQVQLDGDNSDETPFIFDLMEELVGEKILKITGYPSGLCDECLDGLCIGYRFKQKYYQSKEKLKNLLEFLCQKSHIAYYRCKNSKNVISQIVQTEDKDKHILSEENYLNNQQYVEEKLPSIDEQEDNELPKQTISYVKKQVTSENEHHLDTIKYQSLDDGLLETEGEQQDSPDASENIDNLLLEQLPSSSEQEVEFQAPDRSGQDSKDCSSNNLCKVSCVCPKCNESFAAEHNLRKHIKTCKKQNVQCHICKEKQPGVKELISHLTKKHSTERKPISVTLANIPQKGVAKNVLFKIKLRKGPVPMTDFTCKLCGTVLANRKRWNYHMLKHEGTKYTCEECGKTFARDYTLEAHKLNSHNDNRVVEICPICAKVFRYKGGVHSHIKTHSNVLKYECSFCDKKFRYLYTKTNHIKRIHSGETPYKCKFCGRYFKTLIDKSNCEMTHTQEKPHKCEVCGWTFRQRCSLVNHMLRHEGTFECHLCHKQFLNVELLNRHLEIKHSKQENDEWEQQQKQAYVNEDYNCVEENNIQQEQQNGQFIEMEEEKVVTDIYDDKNEVVFLDDVYIDPSYEVIS